MRSSMARATTKATPSPGGRSSVTMPVRQIFENNRAMSLPEWSGPDYATP